MTDLSNLARQAESHSEFVAAKIGAYQQKHNLDDVDLATQLGCKPTDLTHLRLCALPRESHFQEDVERIAEHVHANATELARILSD